MFPVVKSAKSFFTLLAQWQDSTVLMTYLEDYKVNPTTAAAYFCLNYHLDFKESKDLVLVQGEFLPHLSKVEGEKLIDDCLSYYLEDKKYSHVETFNLNSNNFSFEKAFPEMYKF